MNRESVEFSVTGNFQYDAGLLGLINIVNYFDFAEKLNFTICDNTITYPREIMPVIGQLGYLYGFVSKDEAIFSKGKLNVKMKMPDKSKKDKGEKKKPESVIQFVDFEKIVKEAASCSISAKDTIELENIFTTFADNLCNYFDLAKDHTNKAYGYTALNIFNASHLNTINPSSITIKKKKYPIIAYRKCIERFKPIPSNGRAQCLFCDSPTDTPLSRENFLFAPSAINFSWYKWNKRENTPNHFICPYCSAINLFASYATFQADGNFWFVHSPNLMAMVRDYEALKAVFSDMQGSKRKRSFLSAAVRRFAIETQADAERKKDRLIVSMSLSSTKPAATMFRFSSENIDFLIDEQRTFQKLEKLDFVGYSANKSSSPPAVSLFKDTVEAIFEGTNFFDIADVILLGRIKQLGGNRNYNGFIQDEKDSYPGDRQADAAALLQDLIIRQRDKLKGGDHMENLKDLSCFREYGNDLRTKIGGMKGYGSKTAMNKLISMASNLRDAGNDSMERLIEVLIQMSIYTSPKPIPEEISKALAAKQVTSREAAGAIALGLMSEKIKNNHK
ncbi:MAG: hypothetical protein PHW12_03565 [Smithella sp.]|nr:hypothetical protein [Smithella sp.]